MQHFPPPEVPQPKALRLVQEALHPHAQLALPELRGYIHIHDIFIHNKYRVIQKKGSSFITL